MTYKEVIDELTANNIVCYDGEYLNFEGLPTKDLFDLFWKWGQEFLEDDEMKQYLNLPRLYFNDNPDENAGAYRDGEDYKYSLIVFNYGAIEPLYNYFEAKKDGFKGEKIEPYNEVTLKFGIAPDYYLFQIVSLFFLYHETGHLIQMRNEILHYEEYDDDDCEGTEEEAHVMEFDADWFASNRVAMQLIDLNRNLFGEFDTAEKIEFFYKSAELAVAAIYINLIKWFGYDDEIYYQKHCHPHPAVRLVYIVFYIVDTLRARVNIDLNQNRIVRKAIEISIEFMKDENPNPVEEYSKKIDDNLNDIGRYVEKIIEDSKRYPQCCRNVLPLG